MSLLSRNRYTLVIGQARATIVRRRGAWRAAYDLTLDVPIPPGEAGLGEALGYLLGRPEIGAGDLAVVLSNAHVRYQIVPWDDAVTDPAEMRAFAKARFEQVYGADAAAWAVEATPDGAGRPRLAAAIEQALLDRVRAAAGPKKLRLRSVQPYLVAAYNRLRRHIRQSDFAFVVAEASRTCLLAAAGGRWCDVRAGGGGESRDDIADLIDRELQLMNLPGRCPAILVHAPQHAKLQLPPLNGVDPQTLSVPLPASLARAPDPQLVMAMTVN